MPRALVIDDSRSARQIIEMMLVDAGYEVQACPDGDAAVRLLRTTPFDVIVTDIYMPDKDGLEVIRERGDICPQIPIVAMSGIVGQCNMLGVAKHLGACQILQKPFSRDQLLQAVEAAMRTQSPGTGSRR